jgi:hypothetical protein
LVIGVLAGVDSSETDVQTTIDEQRLMKMYDAVRPIKSQAPRTAFLFTDPHRKLTELSRLTRDEVILAKRYAETVRSKPQRAMIQAVLAPVYRAIDPRVAQKWVTDALEALDGIESGPDKVRLGLVLSVTLDDFGEKRKALAMFLDSLELGEELFQLEALSNTGRSVDASQVLGYLSEACERMSSLAERDMVVTRVREVRNPVLRSFLLANCARGIAESTPSRRFRHLTGPSQ